MSANALSSMFQCVSGLRNVRAAVALLGCLVLAALIAILATRLLGGGFGAYLTGGLLAGVFGFAGVHAAGVLLMDQARQITARSIQDAVLYGLLCVPKTIVLVVGLVLAFLAVYALIALLLWLCKIPGLGPVLYAFVYPVSVVGAGVAVFGLIFGFLMALAAIWEGLGVFAAMARVLGIVRSRLVEVVLLLSVALLIVGAMAGLVSAVLAAGALPTSGLSIGILGVRASGFDAFGMLSGGGDAYTVARLFGGAVLACLAATVVLLVWLLGVNLAYLRCSEGLDHSATEGAMHAALADARRKAAEMGAKAKEAAERAKSQAQEAMAQQRAAAESARQQAAAASQAAAVAAADAPGAQPPQPTAAVAAAPVACPACGAAVSPDDAFCGNCGHRMRV